MQKLYKYKFYMESVNRLAARQLLEVKAVKLSPDKPFTWASGWKSPIYCDNRKILSYPGPRKFIYESLKNLAEQNFKNIDVVAGVATGAIAYGALVAEAMGKPFVYVRPKPKDHGTGSQIEGDLPQNVRVLVVEDLISTGGSSLSAVNCLEQNGANVLGMVAIFSYNFDHSRKAFENASCELHTLTTYDTLIEEALECKYIEESQMETLREWRIRPETWGK